MLGKTTWKKRGKKMKKNNNLELSKLTLYGIDPKIIEKNDEIIRRTHKDGLHTFRECFYLFFYDLQQTYIEEGKSPQTIADAESCIRNYALNDSLPYETIADHYVEQITPAEVKQFKRDIEKKNYLVKTKKCKSKKGLSHCRLNNIFGWIDKVFKYAYDHSYIEHKSFLEDIKLTSHGGTVSNKALKRNFLSEKEFDKFNETFNKHASSYFNKGINVKVNEMISLDYEISSKCIFKCLLYRAFYNTAFYTGLRKNEMRALKWEDIYSKKTNKLNFIRVEKQFSDKFSKYVNKADHTRNPKTKNAFRIVCVHPVCYKYLCELKQFLIVHNIYNPTSYIFLDFFVKNPKPIPETNLDRCFKKMLKESHILDNDTDFQVGERRITLHGLRHSSCTMLLEKGMPIEQVAKVLGHSNTHLAEYCYKEFVKIEDSDNELEEITKYFK